MLAPEGEEAHNMVTSTEEYTDTIINVVDFFKAEAMGRVRRYVIDLPRLALDDDLVAEDVHAEFRLLRVGSGLLAEGSVRATVELECVRTLESFPEAVEAEFAEQFRPVVEATTGRVIRYKDDDEEDLAALDYFTLSENHELDMEEPLRQVIIVALPMQPIKPGTQEIHLDETGTGAAEVRANPFTVLESLLQDDED